MNDVYRTCEVGGGKTQVRTMRKTKKKKQRKKWRVQKMKVLNKLEK